MAEIVSLNQYRKARKKAEAASAASENKVRHGRTKADGQRDSAEREIQSEIQDGKRLERQDAPPDTD